MLVVLPTGINSHTAFVDRMTDDEITEFAAWLDENYVVYYRPGPRYWTIQGDAAALYVQMNWNHDRAD